MMRGARSAYLWGTRPSNTCGGSTMWSSAEMTVYFRSARGGSGKKVTVLGPSWPAVVHSELARRSSIDNMARSSLGIAQLILVDPHRGGQRASPGGQLAFGQLAPGRAGQPVEDHEALRIVLLRGSLLGQELDQLGERQRSSRLELHEHADPLTEEGVGHRHRRSQHHRGVGRDRVFDDGGGDVLATSDDDLGLSAYDGEVALLPEGDDVGVQGEPVAGEQLGVGLGIVVIAEAERWSPATRLASPGAGDIDPVVEQSDLGAR